MVRSIMASASYLRFDVEASDGAALPVHGWRVPDAHTAVIALHGATSHGGWFATLASALADHGISTYVPDRRGSGLARELALPASPAQWIDDLRRVIATVARDHDDLALAPWCFGARLAVPTMAGGSPVRRVVFMAPSLFFRRSVSDGFAQGLARGDEFALPSPDDAFVSAPHALAFLAGDPLRWRTMTRQFRELSGQLLEQTQSALPQLDLAMTALFASADQIVDTEQGKALLQAHRIAVRDIDGSHGFFIDDPTAAAALLAPLFAGRW
jgi:esterase/lipase